MRSELIRWRLRISVILLLLGLSWIETADAQRAARGTPSWSVSLSEGRVTASVDRVPLHLVLAELARHAPMRLSVSEAWREHRVTAHFRALPLDEALPRLLTGLPYGIVYDAAPSRTGSAAARRVVEILVFEKAPEVAVAGAGDASALTRNTAAEEDSTLDAPPEWTAVLQHPDTAVRVEALQRWAEQGVATPLNPLMHALVDPDESVRARAQELVERVWAAKADAEAR